MTELESRCFSWQAGLSQAYWPAVPRPPDCCTMIDITVPVGLIQALSIGGWFLAMSTTHGAALLAMGRPQWLSASSVAKLLGMFAFIPAGYYIGASIAPDMAFPGAVLGFSASEILRHATTSYAVSRAKLRTIRLDLTLTVHS